MTNIARLPCADQSWILRRLSSSEMSTLNTWRGLSLLQNPQQPEEESPTQALPAICQTLARKTTLYAAIVIEQGSYPWTPLFLQQFDTDNAIQRAIDTQVSDIKPLVKQAVFSEWENDVAFEHLLDETHG